MGNQLDELPAPLTTPAHDITGFDGFMLNTDRLLASELWALATGDEFKAAMALWCRAWKQSPAGSLPDDPKVLQAFSGAGSKWKNVQEVALRGFIKCSDGRLYHRFLCEDVLRAAVKKAERRDRTKAATEARQKQRNDERDGQRDVDHKPNVTTSHRLDTSGKEDKKDREESKIGEQPQPAALPKPAKPQTKGTRLSDDWFPEPLSQTFLKQHTIPEEIQIREFEKFRNYWQAKPGAGAIKLDWNATWRNWLLNNYSGVQNGKSQPQGTIGSGAKFFKDLDTEFDRREQNGIEEPHGFFSGKDG